LILKIAIFFIKNNKFARLFFKSSIYKVNNGFKITLMKQYYDELEEISITLFLDFSI